MELFAKKSLGQHFLNSPKALRDIVSAAHIEKGETLLEIGPGTGILTKELIATGAHVVAVEKDDRAVELLREKFASDIAAHNLELIHGDVLDASFSPNFASREYAVVANIPYYITGAILERFLEHAPRPNRMVLLVQKEVAERIVAKDGKESILSVSVKAFGQPKIIGTVPRGAFTPPPKVDSAILAIENISDREFSTRHIEIRDFFTILHAGFAHKRKFLMRNLEAAIPASKIREFWLNHGLNEKARPEDMAVHFWFDIAALGV